MTNWKLRVAALAGTISIVTVGCGSATPAPSSAGATSAGTPPASVGPPATGLEGPTVTLKLAVADAAADPSGPVVTDLIQQVASLSGGKLTIVPTYSAGHNFEEGVVELVQRGDADLGIAASRAWDLKGENALRGLQAPFLIDNDALLDAVAASDIPADAVQSMQSAVGLGIWPEDLRHLSSFSACGADLRTAAAFSGTKIFMLPSNLSYRTLEALGAARWPEQGTLPADRNADAATCRMQGMESGMLKVGATPMSAHPVTASNITLFAKFQVVAANKKAFDALSSAQQSVLRAAVEATTQAAIKARKPDAALAAGWCSAGGAITLARPGAQEAFAAAVAPVLAELDQDAAAKAIIAGITALKAMTPAAAPAQPCAASSRATPVPLEAVDTAGYVGTVPPNGTFRRQLVASDLIAAGLEPRLAHANEQVLTHTFDDGRLTTTNEVNCTTSTCESTYRSVDVEYVTAVGPGSDDGCGIGHVVWREEPNGISFVYLEEGFLPSDHILLDYWVWTRIN